MIISFDSLLDIHREGGRNSIKYKDFMCIAKKLKRLVVQVDQRSIFSSFLIFVLSLFTRIGDKTVGQYLKGYVGKT